MTLKLVETPGETYNLKEEIDGVKVNKGVKVLYGFSDSNISNNILSINKNYVDMSGNQQKYDFTGKTIYALEKEDRSLSSALLKDNAVYNEEQNNLVPVVFG